ncbi:ABC transporter ATP-binding protein [Herbaspirillum sp. alder98]|uniref:ABC transporter ATP-binding protein n=1 Tax=Herbaspirillum sp. alder98 TaxID=2913096 RepID=UPI001CD905A8|nr:ABC transporter ATP-binding protein [Herbaspirillum sp. alder98]MCA1326406.1 ABC transporter ATP-binding protein [Herbaspirillum sp. alder98]
MEAKAAQEKLGTELKLRGISKFYGDAAAVRELDLDIKAGEFVTLLGSSGSGKTTTLMMLAGFTAPSSGQILIGGRDVTKLPPGKRDLGVVFQNYALFPHLTVAQNLAFPLEMRGVSKSEIARRVADGLAQVQLADKGERLPRELSGGQQQRIALARALIFRPQAMLMDEPLGALDKNLREHMQMEIRRLHRNSGATVVFVTHDQEEALTMSDRIAVMQDGGIAQIAAPAEIYDRPANQWVAQFIGQSNTLDGKVVERTDSGKYVVELSGGARIQASGPANLSEGVSVVGILRPEKITMGQGTEGNSVSGRIREMQYLGHMVKLLVEQGGGQTLQVMAQLQRMTDAAQWSEGSQVNLGWQPESVWLVPAEEA